MEYCLSWGRLKNQRILFIRLQILLFWTQLWKIYFCSILCERGQKYMSYQRLNNKHFQSIEVQINFFAIHWHNDKLEGNNYKSNNSMTTSQTVARIKLLLLSAVSSQKYYAVRPYIVINHTPKNAWSAWAYEFPLNVFRQ